MLAIIIFTSIVSLIGFRNSDIFNKLKFNAYYVSKKKEWYRVFTHAFLHADWIHLIVNMLVLIIFGVKLEQIFISLGYGKITLYALYFIAIIVSSIHDLLKYKNNEFYNAIGASGAVAAVLFSYIFFSPKELIYIYGAIPIPAYLFAIGYIAYSFYMGKNSKSNIGHFAHLYGAIFGFVFPILLNPALLDQFMLKMGL